jgi:cell division transport system permease protein
VANPVKTPDALQRPSWLLRLLQDHARAFFFTLGTLVRNPTGTLLTAAVIGITLALPAGFHLAVKNLSTLSYSWESALQASLFLKDSVSEARGRELSGEIGKRDGVTKTQYISREQALAEFRVLSGFGEALQILETNPLPAVIVVTPSTASTTEQTQSLLRKLGELPEVEIAKLDQEWLQRLQALLALAQRAVLVIAAVLALAVIIIVGNTIRLDLEARREEIAVMKLIGAPTSFIRRPFLYAGVWYGLAGGVLAWSLVQGGRLLLAGPARHLTELYGSSFSSIGLSLTASLALLASGLALGLAGAQLTVSRHLSRIEPD